MLLNEDVETVLGMSCMAEQYLLAVVRVYLLIQVLVRPTFRQRQLVYIYKNCLHIEVELIISRDFPGN